MNLLIAFAVGLLTGSFLTIFCMAATMANHFDEGEDTDRGSDGFGSTGR